MISRRGILGGAATLFAFPRTAGADPEERLTVFGSDPQNLATPKSFFTREIIPNPVFFVRSHFGPPAFDKNRKLAVEGLVKSKLSLSVADLKSLPEASVTAVLQCSGNGRSFHSPRVPGVQWDHGAMGQAKFTGVRLADVLEKAGLDAALKKGTHLHVRGADLPPKPTVPAFVRSLPIERALDPSTLIAFRMNDEDLPHAHGGPMRLVVPGWAGDHWVKWLTRIALEKEEAPGFYMQTAYRLPVGDKTVPATAMPVKSVIGRAAGRTVTGIAFSGEAPIAKVEVSLDEGKTWKPAKLSGEGGIGRWQVFTFEVPAETTGKVRAVARATDKKGNVQPEKAQWNPSGYFFNSWDSAEWDVQ